jgi:hypothetical protein
MPRRVEPTVRSSVRRSKAGCRARTPPKFERTCEAQRHVGRDRSLCHNRADAVGWHAYRVRQCVGAQLERNEVLLAKNLTGVNGRIWFCRGRRGVRRPSSMPRSLPFIFFSTTSLMVRDRGYFLCVVHGPLLPAYLCAGQPLSATPAPGIQTFIDYATPFSQAPWIDSGCVLPCDRMWVPRAREPSQRTRCGGQRQHGLRGVFELRRW